VRFVGLKAADVPSAKALVQSASSTLIEDSAALNAEARAGGVVSDPVAEAMNSLISSDALAEAIEDFQAEAPAAQPTAANVKELLRQAKQVEAASANAPKEPSDELIEDLLLAGEPESSALVPTGSTKRSAKGSTKAAEEVPFYKNPVVVIGILGGVGLLWYSTRR